MNDGEKDMCYKPINIRQADGRYMKVKCGKCLECLNEKRNAWVIRMNEELKEHNGKGVFFTLTYSDDNIPKNFLVYEQSLTEEPKLFESESDYNYATPDGFRGKKSYSEPVDKVLQKFYSDYDIKEITINNNIKNIKDEYEEVFRSVSLGSREDDAHLDEGFFSDLCDRITDDEPVGTDADCSMDYTYCSDNQIRDIKDWDYEYVRRTFEEASVEEGGCSSQDIQQTAQGGISGVDYPYGEGVISSTTQVSPEVVAGDGQARIKPLCVLAFNSVRQKDLQDWLKRGRAKLTRQGKNFTYFITSEYGPRTLRPHYHGCFFGVSVDDVRFMFQDWQARFGRRISYDNIHGTAGCGYCAKYCAKGFYEHPLCSKDFFYVHDKYINTGDNSLDELLNRLEFTEYHSKHYERCLEFFGIDAPIVTPTFKLVSKGLGIGYVSRMKDYFQLDEAEEKISLTKYSQDYEREFREVMDEVMGEIKRYFHYTNEKGFTFSMPHYYRTKMFSDNLRRAFANYVRSQYDRLYYEQFRALQAEQPDRKDAEIISYMEEEQRRQKVSSLSRKLDTIQKFYNKSKI